MENQDQNWKKATNFVVIWKATNYTTVSKNSVQSTQSCCVLDRQSDWETFVKLNCFSSLWRNTTCELQESSWPSITTKGRKIQLGLRFNNRGKTVWIPSVNWYSSTFCSLNPKRKNKITSRKTTHSLHQWCFVLIASSLGISGVWFQAQVGNNAASEDIQRQHTETHHVLIIALLCFAHVVLAVQAIQLVQRGTDKTVRPETSRPIELQNKRSISVSCCFFAV